MLPAATCTVTVQLHDDGQTSLGSARSARLPRGCGLWAPAGLHHVRQPVLVALAQQPVSLVHHLQSRRMHTFKL